MVNRQQRALGVGILCAVLAMAPATGYAGSAEAKDSQRLELAKDLIAEEQWLRAIQELKVAADDPKEPSRDEALFWLAHSQNQARQYVAALQSITRLQQTFPASRWMKPAQSLQLEIAQRLGRFDVLWQTARPATAPTAPAAGATTPGAASEAAVAEARRAPRAATTVRPAARPARGEGAPRVVTIQPEGGEATTFVVRSMSDPDLRIQALGSLIRTDAEQVIPILKQIALESENPGEARRALFVLAQSGRPDARATVVEVARSGAEPVRLAAVRELGRSRGAAVATELMQVYSTATGPLKHQVVSALGERAATMQLLRIAQQETDRAVRDAAITTLGAAGGRDELHVFYARAAADAKRPVIAGLFSARADQELIRIARTERNAELRSEVLARLSLLNTAAAREYLASVGAK